ncbi:MAG: DUF721 domain-containing protein [Verrucomicrobia bacterium]|jgi:predicted nucleic acid-binding Zn ribbon protein|nr:DUF721 domain-containing protein [Verrucomicrobiota bacterium]
MDDKQPSNAENKKRFRQGYKDSKKTKEELARQQALRQWNRADTEDQEKLMAFRPDQASDLVNKALQTLRIEDRTSESQILKAWNHLIDPTLTAHAQPVGIRKGTLFVNVDHSTWLSEIVRYRREEILERLQHCFGKDMIQRISFRVG